MDSLKLMLFVCCFVMCFSSLLSLTCNKEVRTNGRVTEALTTETCPTSSKYTYKCRTQAMISTEHDGAQTLTTQSGKVFYLRGGWNVRRSCAIDSGNCGRDGSRQLCVDGVFGHHADINLCHISCCDTNNCNEDFSDENVRDYAEVKKKSTHKKSHN